MSNDLIRLRLLAHSQNMLNAAQQAEWQTLVELDAVWQELLSDAIDRHRGEVEIISSQLLENNSKIQEILNGAQKGLLQNTVDNAKAHKAIKQYLK